MEAADEILAKARKVDLPEQAQAWAESPAL